MVINPLSEITYGEKTFSSNILKKVGNILRIEIISKYIEFSGYFQVGYIKAIAEIYFNIYPKVV